MYIGKRVQELRKAKGMSLTELAEKSGVQIATLSRVENMKMTGTLESHMNIARAMGVDVTQLYTAIIKEEDKAQVQTPKSLSDVFVHSEKSSYEILTSNILGKRMMPILLKIEPEGRPIWSKTRPDRKSLSLCWTARSRCGPAKRPMPSPGITLSISTRRWSTNSSTRGKRRRR